VVVVICPQCQSILYFSGKYRVGPRPCLNCKQTILVPDKPMTDEEIKKATDAHRQKG
jgi:hypothetical protein